MGAFVDGALQLALVVMVVLLALSTYRLWAGPGAADRLQAADAATTLLMGIIVLLAAARGDAMLMDMAIALAAFGVVGTLAVARYLAEGGLL